SLAGHSFPTRRSSDLECVYMALVTDTGSFHFPNTTERTLKVASELVKAGVRPASISEAVYNNYPWSRIELMRQVLNTVQRDDSRSEEHTSELQSRENL